MSATIEAAKPEAAQGLFYADADAAEAFGRRLLLAHDLPAQDAARVGMTHTVCRPCRIISTVCARS
jgi:hypothetical protein